MRLSRLLAVAIAAAAFAVVAPAAHADDYFLKVDSITADEQPAPGMTGFMRINAFEWGADADRTTRSYPRFSALTVNKTVDATSPVFLGRLGLGNPLRFVEIVVRKAGTTGAPGSVYLRYCFQSAFVSGLQHGAADEGVEETVKFAYGAVGMTFTKQDVSGTPTGSVFAGWNEMNNQFLTAPGTGCSR